MIVKAKYYSTCPCCGEGINVGSMVEWEKGKQAIHCQCVVLTPEQIMSGTNKNLVFLEEVKAEKDYNSYYIFEWTMKSGKKKLMKCYKNGDVYEGEKERKTLLGLRY